MRTKYLYESVSEPAFNNKEVAIITYNNKDASDRAELQSLRDILWQLIYNAYNGNVVGMSDGKKLLERSTVVRVAFYNQQPVAAAFYSNRQGGNKMMYCGAVRGELHKIGKQAFEAIVQRDSDGIPLELNWAEVSGPVEECFAKCEKAYNLPNRYVGYVLQSPDIELCNDEYHYRRPIGSNREVFTKTIYGLPSLAILNKLTEEVMGHACNNIQYCWQQILLSQQLSEACNHAQILTEDKEPLLRKYGLGLIDHCVELYSDYNIREMPPYILGYLRSTVQLLSAKYSGDYTVDMAIKDANEILDTTEPLEFLPYVAKIEKVKVA